MKIYCERDEKERKISMRTNQACINLRSCVHRPKEPRAASY